MRPRFRMLALVAIGIGLALVVYALFIPYEVGKYPLTGGVAGALLGLLYLGSPAWRLEVVIDDEALEVVSRRRSRFRLRWDEVSEVIASPKTGTCFVDGGSPERSLLVPGPGASAPYDIAHKQALFDAICARVAKERIREVELLEREAIKLPSRRRRSEAKDQASPSGEEDQS